MIAIVTGASGFIGSHLVTALLAGGNHVRCLTRNPRPLSGPTAPSVTYHRIDYARPDLGLAPGLWADVDTIYHLAGVTLATSPAVFRAGNVQSTRHLLSAITAAGARPRRFLFVSSQAAGGPAERRDQPVTEDSPGEPLEPYGASKRAAERVVAEHGGQVPFTIVRPAAVYGPRDEAFLPLFQWARHGLAIYPAIRDRWVSIIAVDDLVKGVLQAATLPNAAGRTYFLANDEPAQWRSIYLAAADAAGRTRLTEVNLPQPLVNLAAAGGDLWAAVTGHIPLLNRNKIALSRPPLWICSGVRARRELGFSTSVSLHEGIRQTYDWYVRNHWL